MKFPWDKKGCYYINSALVMVLFNSEWKSKTDSKLTYEIELKCLKSSIFTNHPELVVPQQDQNFNVSRFKKIA